MKKNNQLQDTFDSFEEFMEAGMVHMSNKPGNHFRSCYIDFEEPDEE
jgi:hypothetical protein